MKETDSHIIIPPRLQAGDTVGLITPAGPILDWQSAHAGIKILQDAGFLIKLPAEMKEENYLAGSDQERADQLVAMWADPEVKAVLAMRGGYGTMRLLPFLNLKQFADNPKILAGFSDISILLNEVQHRTGLVTYHTPVLTTLSRSDSTSQRTFLEMLTRSAEVIVPEDIKILTGGNSRGKLIGGNLASLSHLLGTPYEPNWRNAILFIEDVGEAPYAIDRMLTQLNEAGCLPQLSGLIMGTFSKDGDREEEEWSEPVWARALALTRGKIPLWGNFPIGHGKRNLTVPVGMTTIMNSKAGTLEFINP